MLNKVNIGRFYDTKSLIHSMNSTIKIICTIMFAIFSFLSYNLYINLLIIALLVLMILLSKVPIILYLKSIFSIKWFLIFIFIINIIFEHNLYIALLISLRIIYVLIYTMMLIFTTKQDDIIFGLQKTFSPLKILNIPINKMAFSVGLALRFIPDLLASFNRILKLQVNKGIYFKDLKFKDKIDLIKISVISMFTLSIKKADSLSDSMEVRLYNIDNYRCYIKGKFEYFDLLVILVHVMLFILIIREEVFI